MDIPARASIALADQRQPLLGDLDLITLPLRVADQQFGLTQPVIVTRLEAQRPARLGGADHRQRLFRGDHFDRRRLIGNGIEPVAAVIDKRGRAGQFDAVDSRGVDGAAAGPERAVALQALRRSAVVEAQARRRSRSRSKPQPPGQQYCRPAGGHRGCRAAAPAGSV